MADYHHKRSRYITVTIARIVGHHHSTISRFEIKNQTQTMLKTFRDQGDPYHLLGKIKHNEGWSEGNPLQTNQS